jgi:hypothetical protein
MFGGFALRGGGAAYGATRGGHWLNHNRYLRIGPGKMPAVPSQGPLGYLKADPKVPRISLGPDRPGLTNRPHGDLSSRVPKLPPIGGLFDRCSYP